MLFLTLAICSCASILTRLSDASQFLRLGKRFIINLDYVYQINVQRQFIVLSDYDHFAYKVGVSKDALKKLKQIMVSARR